MKFVIYSKQRKYKLNVKFISFFGKQSHILSLLKDIHFDVIIYTSPLTIQLLEASETYLITSYNDLNNIKLGRINLIDLSMLRCKGNYSYSQLFEKVSNVDITIFIFKHNRYDNYIGCVRDTSFINHSYVFRILMTKDGNFILRNVSSIPINNDYIIDILSRGVSIED